MVQHRENSFWFIAIDLSLPIVYYDRPKMSIKNPLRWCTVGGIKSGNGIKIYALFDASEIFIPYP
jgi:hypothetical protein